MTSINTNVGALVALRNLSSTSYNLDVTQNRVSTGSKITGPKDDASNFSIAQGLRADLKAFDAVQQGLSSARGIVTARGGMTSHAAVVARGMGRACVSGAGEIDIAARRTGDDGHLVRIHRVSSCCIGRRALRRRHKCSR